MAGLIRHRRFSLRWRVAVIFGLGSLALVSALATATWNLTTGYMLAQREQSATSQAQVNVRLVDDAIRTGSGGLDELLTGFTTSPDSTILVSVPGRWITSGRRIAPSDLPAPLLTLAREGRPARQRIRAGDVPLLAVALPTSAGGFYVQLFSLTELDRTFRFLSSLLISGALACAVLAATLGWWASGRALRPLIALTAAASRVAGGDLTARLPHQDDPDLAPLAATFNSTAEALEQRVRRDARFASDVSHELRSPVTTMVNAAEVIQRRRDDLPATVRQALDLLLAEVHRFRRMVVDLLEISRADQHADTSARELVDLAELVRNVVAHRSAPMPPVEAAPTSLCVSADRRRLDRVLSNLLDNAERYGRGVVRLAVLAHDDHVRLEVDDNGPGVPAEMRDQIFERFARGTEAGRRGTDTGSGLGLAIVAEHVTRHGGSVRVEDRPGGGARFVVELPRVEG